MTARDLQGEEGEGGGRTAGAVDRSTDHLITVEDSLNPEVGEEMRLIAIFSVLTLAALTAFPASGSHTWSGEVLDVRTGLPIEGVSVKAGLPGRVDAFPGYEQITGPDGKFSITWPEDSWDWMGADKVNHYLRVNPPSTWKTEGTASGYMQATVIRPSPEYVTVYLVPRAAFIKGVAVSASDGTPLPDLKLSLRHPGGIRETVRTDENGEFAFSPINGFRSDNNGWPLTVYDVYPPGLTDDRPLDPGEYQTPAIGVNDPKYHDMLPPTGDDWQYTRTLELITSTTDDLHTYVVLKVPEKDQPLPADAITSEIRGLR